MFVIALVVAALGGCRNEPGTGARIAEPGEGAWTAVCSATVEGPERPGRVAEGDGLHKRRKEARRRAVVSACRKANGGAPCRGGTGGWTVAKEHCRIDGATKDDSTAKERRRPSKEPTAPDKFRCSVEVRRPAGRPRGAAQANAPEAAKACERAVRKACKAASGGAPCSRGETGWTIESTRGRIRPS